MTLSQQIESLPTTPGVYLFKNRRGRILYVGKAQNLRSRVRSYFGATPDGRPHWSRLVEQIADLSVVVTPTAKDALLLENELIKRHRPPFNVRLRDDKQYLQLRLDPREPWPRLVPVRRSADDGAQYFGPYTSSGALREVVSNLRRVFPLRSCTDAVFRDYARRGRPCIEFEMNRCAAPCCQKVDEPAYAEMVRGTTLFLRGRSRDLVRELEAEMGEAAREERFEEAARLRDRLAAIHATLERQQIVSDRAVDRDVFGMARRGGEVEIHALHVRAGRVVGTASFSFSEVHIPDGDVLASFLSQYYGVQERSTPPEIVVPATPEDRELLEGWLGERIGRRVRVRVGGRGEVRRLADLAGANARLELERRLEARQGMDRVLRDLRDTLGLRALPRRVECYDVSTLQGTLAVASRVVFQDGRPDKNAYRRYRIREATGGNDLACLREVLDRRLARVDTEALPDLLMVDGGRGQLDVAVAALGAYGAAIDALGLAKERDAASGTARVRRGGGLKAERVYLPGRAEPVRLPPSAPGLLLLQRVRDEAHRFAIEFQRSLRRRIGLTSILEEVPGIGPRKRRALLQHLGSLRAVRDASKEELARVPGITERDARAIRRFLEALAPE